MTAGMNLFAEINSTAPLGSITVL
uniref:Uncharacterized protein n=1 Tax=Anguilla anguilla TaxID=7936 RepID=A0A0E9RDJ4_ANGAN